MHYWLNLALQFFLSYISTVCFGILLHIPSRAYNVAGVIGGGSWVIYWVMYYQDGVGLAFSNLFAAVLIALCSRWAAQHKKMPAIVFEVSALVPFVPGGQAYKMVRNFAIGNYYLVTVYFYQVVVIVGAITLGFGLGELLNRIIHYRRWKIVKKNR